MQRARPGVTRMFASVVAGTAPLVSRELGRLPGVRVTDTGWDGRSDLILIEVDRGHREAAASLRSVEDLYLEVGRAARADGDRPPLIAQRVWRRERVEKALSAWSQAVRPLSGAMGYRVIARVLQERSFRRTALREALSAAIARDRPRWKIADPAQIEVWIAEYRPGLLVAGLRLSDAAMRQHGGRAVERPGALRPTVAAMMIGQAGPPDGILLDPCCGSGTILAEALAAGWTAARGGDIDPDAVQAARANVPGAQVGQGDARQLALGDAAVGAVVSNLPFGRQYAVPGDPSDWLTAVLAEMARVTRPGGRVVLLAPDLPAGTLPPRLRGAGRDRLRLLGTPTTLWTCEVV
jgi:SAM-dependent methyltransferase